MRFQHLGQRSFALLLVSLSLIACDTDTKFPPLVEGPAVDPEKYRGPLMRIDTLIYTDGPLDDKRRGELSARLESLSELIATREFRAPAPNFARELRVLAGLAGHTRLDLEIEDTPLRPQWERIRGSLFEDASWFARSPADLRRPPPGPNPMLVSSAVVTALARTIDQTLDLARNAPNELDEFARSHPNQEDSTEEDAAIEAAWSDWCNGWKQQLEELEEQLPSDPDPFANPLLRSALGETKEALRTLRMVPSLNGVLSEAERVRWNEHFTSVVQRLGRARESAAKISQN